MNEFLAAHSETTRDALHQNFQDSLPNFSLDHAARERAQAKAKAEAGANPGAPPASLRVSPFNNRRKPHKPAAGH